MRLVEQSSTHQWLGLKTSPPSSSIPALYCWWLLLLNSDIYVAGAMGRPKGLNTGFRDTSRRSGAALRVWLACVSARARASQTPKATWVSPWSFPTFVVYLDQPKDLPPCARAKHPLFPDARAYKRRLLSLPLL
jgi:hypothetical protein